MRQIGLLVGLLALAVIAHITPARALLPGRPHDVVCPLTGEVFQWTGIASSLQVGTRLDLRPIGTVPVFSVLGICPDETKFPIFKEHFTEDEIARLRQFVQSDRYKALLSGNPPPPYIIAKLKQFLGDDEAEVAYAVLAASWVTDNEGLAAVYREEARDLYARVAGGNPSSERTVNARFLQIELSRQAGYFAEAAALIAKYDTDTPWLRANVTPAILAQEDDLIRHLYGRPARIGEVAPWNASLIRLDVRPGLAFGAIEWRVRVVFPELRKQATGDSRTLPAVFDLYTLKPGAEWQDQLKPLILNNPSALGEQLAMQHDTNFFASGNGAVSFYTSSQLTRGDQYHYQLCGYVTYRTIDGPIQRIRINDGGVVTDIGGRAFQIEYDDGAFFLYDTTADRPHVMSRIEKGHGCRGTPNEPNLPSLTRIEK